MTWYQIVLIFVIWILLGLQGQRMFVRYLRYQYKGSLYKGNLDRWIAAAFAGPLSVLVVYVLVYKWHSSDDG